ncbi:MAG: Rid family hydrolase [Candidatus Nanopelagicales bacterium]
MAVHRFSSGGIYEDLVGYSRVVVASGFAGHTGWTAGTTALVNGVVQHPGDPQGQARVAFQSALFALERSGFARADIVQTRMYVVDLAAHCDAVGRAHADLFDEVRPAATMIGVSALVDPQMLVEVELVAWRPEDGSAA